MNLGDYKEDLKMKSEQLAQKEEEFLKQFEDLKSKTLY